MAKSIRLKSPTQVRVEDAVAKFRMDTGVTLSDAALVDVLVNEALDARANVAARQEQARKAVRK
jgi:hypothetical protein